jgi:hypothetical protein
LSEDQAEGMLVVEGEKPNLQHAKGTAAAAVDPNTESDNLALHHCAQRLQTLGANLLAGRATCRSS